MPWPVHPNGLLGAQGDNDNYQISRSLRFNSGDSAYLNRTPGSASNRKTWTWSGWVKRGAIDANRRWLFNSGTAGTDSGSFAFEFFSDYTIRVASGLTQFLLSEPLYRDPSAWYHIVLSVNTTNLTTSDRIIVYVNGSRISTSSYTAPSTDLDTAINNNAAHFIGCYESGPSLFFNGYLTEINFIDGQALTPSSFGETDAITGRWKAKAYSGTYGTNGFYLKFADNSSTAALGTDSSGNGNTWTTNNFSVTAGVDNDSLVDSPTNYGSDTGAGGTLRGNYATLNPLAAGSYVTASNGNLQATFTSGAAASCIGSTIAVSSGKWYWEITVGAVSSPRYPDLGIASSTSNLSTGVTSTNLSTINGKRYSANGDSESGAYGATFTTNDVIGFALNMDSGTLVCYKNNVSQGTNATGLSGSWMPAVSGFNSASFDINFGQRPFAYTAPTGFKALCTTNLTTPTIKKPSSYMDVVTYTGTGASNSISSLGFSPDLVWIKNRGGATSHAIYDTTRLATKQLSSDTTGDEATSSTGLTAFGSNGFTLGTSTLVNTSGTQYVAWAWDEATIAGMDVIDYTGNGANRTIAHTLGVAPKMVVVKARTTAGADQGWPVWHTSIANTTYLQLNSTSATATGTDYWNSTSPTSSVFSVGTNAAVNTSADTYIAYAFAEVEGFSKFGSYDGNGSADGPFVYCGFRPRWVMIKQSSTSGNNWQIIDAARSDFNFADKALFPSTSGAEGTGNATIDIVSSGFKIRTADGTVNTSSATYIFAAFAESPFKYARAR